MYLEQICPSQMAVKYKRRAKMMKTLFNENTTLYHWSRCSSVQIYIGIKKIFSLSVLNESKGKKNLPPFELRFNRGLICCMLTLLALPYSWDEELSLIDAKSWWCIIHILKTMSSSLVLRSATSEFKSFRFWVFRELHVLLWQTPK